MNADMSFKIDQFVLNMCNLINLWLKLKQLQLFALYKQTRRDMDANFAENYTFFQGLGRNNVVPNL